MGVAFGLARAKAVCVFMRGGLVSQGPGIWIELGAGPGRGQDRECRGAAAGNVSCTH